MFPQEKPYTCPVCSPDRLRECRPQRLPSKPVPSRGEATGTDGEGVRVGWEGEVGRTGFLDLLACCYNLLITGITSLHIAFIFPKLIKPNLNSITDETEPLDNLVNKVYPSLRCTRQPQIILTTVNSRPPSHRHRQTPIQSNRLDQLQRPTRHRHRLSTLSLK